MGNYREPIFHDRQKVVVVGPITTTSTTFVDIPGAILTTKDLGLTGNYQAWLSLSIQQSNNNSLINFRAVIDGVPGGVRSVDFGPSSADNPHHVTVIAQRENVVPNITVQIQWSVSAGTGQINDLIMMIDGIPEVRVVE